MTLETLALVESVAELEALIERRGVERFVTVPTQHEGEMVLLWEPDAGYATADPTVPGARHRMRIPANALGGGSPQFYERSHD